ncbi:MAG: hypothetical protein WBE65_09905 [Steroidobacteraceae bacterium]
MPDFVDQLQASPEERSKLRSLGAKSAYALLALRKASPEAFDALFHKGRADEIATELRSLVTAEELEKLKSPVRRPGSLGARLGPLPKKEPPSGSK